VEFYWPGSPGSELLVRLGRLLSRIHPRDELPEGLPHLARVIVVVSCAEHRLVFGHVFSLRRRDG
jgi:hypothetical protein